MDWQTLFSGLAAGIALAALIKSHYDGEARSRWEADQTTRRENFEKQLARQQHDWQQEQERRRQHERAEDIIRAIEEATPKVRVRVINGFRRWGGSTIYVYIFKIQNVGRVGVYISSVYVTDPDGRAVHTLHQTSVTFHSWESANLTTKELPAYLPPTSEFEVHWVRGQLKETLRDDYVGVVEVKAVAQDGAGTNYESDPWPVDLDQDE